MRDLLLRVRARALAISSAVVVLAHAAVGTAVTVSADDIEGQAAAVVTVVISLDNDVAVRALQLHLTDIPDQLTLVAGSVRTTPRSAGLVPDANELADGSVLAVLLSAGTQVIAPGSGAVLELDFQIATDAPLGTITLDLSEVQAADQNGMPLPVDTRNGSVLIPSPTPTVTVTATVTQTLTATLLPTVAPTGTPTNCIGDCDGSGGVTVDELIVMVNIALGNADVSSCKAGDTDRSGQITIDEILGAVNRALNGCGAGIGPAGGTVVSPE
jgi:Cohesin domain